ncbi:hypothetical protein [Sphingomonas sp. PR090111-T3T-6A]|uniref:hypothetical protein n=1 Tax=Sphingomonas sp. PR090111-T3T-6A TaxID=685778 RepID=UPI00036698CE|nr:hypothetical protein [Sphingomonas sp. PR090111-T3T-6A]
MKQRRLCRHRIRRRRHRLHNRRLPAILFALPALLLLSVPAQAMGSRSLLIPVCNGDGSHIFIRLDLDGKQPPQPDNDHGPGLCLHATCPGESRLKRKTAAD